MKNPPKQIKNLQWFLWEKVPQGAWLWLIWSPAVGFASKMNEYYGVGYFDCVWVYKDRGLYMYAVEEALQEVGKKMIEREYREQGFLLSILSDIERFSGSVMQEAHALQERGIETLSNQELAEAFSKVYALHEEMWARGQTPNLLEHGYSLLGAHLKVLIKNAGVPADQIAHVMNIITTPRSYSSLQEEEQDMLALADAYSPASLHKHWKKYAWLGIDWTGGEGYAEEYFRELAEELCKDKERHKYIKSEEMHAGSVNEKRSEVIVRYSLSADIVHIAHTLEQIIIMKAYRVDASWQLYWTLEPMMTRIAKDHYLSRVQTWFLKPDEIVSLLRGGSIDGEILHSRSRAYALSIHDGLVEEISGTDAVEVAEYLEHTTRRDYGEVKELHGDTGCPGKARGVVRVVNCPEEMHKMEKGDVLVSHITNPRLVPAMKKAAAIVADVGGVTSHAAIVSRELGIPCVVGTKIATDVLKDGMEVDVDADNGLVTIL